MSEQCIFISICFLEVELPNLGYVLLLSSVLLGAASAKLSARPCAGWVAAQGQAGHGTGLISGTGTGCVPPPCLQSTSAEMLSSPQVIQWEEF